MAREYLEHTTQIGDRWDLIAYTYYGDAKRIAPLLLANPDIVGKADTPTPLLFDRGVKIRIPVLTDTEIAQTVLPPWKRT